MLTASYFHGNDGLGDVDIDIQVSLDQVQMENAVKALIRLVNEYPGMKIILIYRRYVILLLFHLLSHKIHNFRCNEIFSAFTFGVDIYIILEQ